MAPMVCLPDMVMPRTDAACPYARRRPRSRLVGSVGGKHRAAEMRQMSIARSRSESSYNTQPASPDSAPDSPIGDLCFPNSPESSLCARIPVDRDSQWIIAKRRQGLLNIVARTIALVRRNHILEKKVEALRLETRRFISSVLNNPENKGNERRQESTVRCSVDSEMNDEISSSTDDEFAQSCSSSSTFGTRSDDSRRIARVDSTAVTSTCNATSTERETRSPDLLDR